jgi:hypothetical protein
MTSKASDEQRPPTSCRICSEVCSSEPHYTGLCKRCGSKREEYAKVLLSAVALGELRAGSSTWTERVRQRLDDVFALADEAVRRDERAD